MLSKVDYLGFMRLFAACEFLIVALEGPGIRYAWSDPLPIAFLVVPGLRWIEFFALEKVVNGDGHTQEPVSVDIWSYTGCSWGCYSMLSK